MKKSKIKATAIIVAGGVGSRMGSEIPKQFIEVLGKPIISYTINAVSLCSDIDSIIIVTLPEYIVYCKDVVDEFGFGKVKKIVCGGATRTESVYNGLKELDDDCEIVVIHDGVRPLIDAQTISKSISAAMDFGASAVGVKMKDTIKIADASAFIEATADREKLWQIQTPQTFKRELICSLHEEASQKDVSVTDDCSLAELAGHKIKIIEGKYENIKITSPQDIYILKGLLGD